MFPVDAWEPVLRAFGAQRIDGRLTRLTWLADVLLDGTPLGGYPQVPSGTLDATTAWRSAMNVLVGVDAGEPDVRSLLEWTLDPTVLARWTALLPERSTELSQWLLSVVGPGAELPLSLLKSGHGADAVPIGLVCGVLFAGEGEPSGVRGAAAIRLERWTGGIPIGPARGRAFAAAAEELLNGLTALGDDHVAGLVTRADVLLRELGAESEAWDSRWLPRGFSQRLDRFAHALTEALQAADAARAMSRGAERLRDLREHAGAADDPERVRRAGQALRLTRYVRTLDREPPASFRHAVAAYASNHAFADVARYDLYASEVHPALGAALGAVTDRATESRERFTQEFARLVLSWFRGPSDGEGLVSIENVLASVVAPLAADGRVLLLVVDGMNAVVAESLSASISRRGWVRVSPAGAPDRMAVVPALPSVTEVCRTSLLCGRLQKGTASDERAGFATHPSLIALSKPAFPPRLFHKASFGPAAELDPEVAAAIANPDQRIVATVVNAVDDHLLKDDMVRPIWTTEYVPVIGALCDGARAAGRRIVMTADHGHVLDLKISDKKAGDRADRYRPAASPAREGEVEVSGSRVLAEDNRVVVAASERVRYTGRKNGYHGGISPQEMVVPLVILAPEGSRVEGYREVASPRPGWWDLELPVASVPVLAPAAAARLGLPLFDATAERPVVVKPEPEPWWLERLFAGEVLKAQRTRVVRAAVSDHRLRALLLAVSSRGGRMTIPAVSERLAMPAGRVPSTVAASAHLLNFDGYQVLFMEGDEVVLDETLLVTQFEIERA